MGPDALVGCDMTAGAIDLTGRGKQDMYNSALKHQKSYVVSTGCH